MEHILKKAREIAERAHQGQVDKSGQPYLLHPIAVSEMGETIEEKIVGMLHDVVEDSEITLEDLRAEGIPEDIVADVDRITRRPGESVRLYMNRIKQSERSVRVKLKDLTHNSDLSRISNPTEEDYKRIERYHRYKKDLEGTLKCLTAS
jgi:(p)ppGpp synthase/HD superfamily hydrolase